MNDLNQIYRLNNRKNALVPSDIVLFKGEGNYTWIYLSNGSKRLLCKTMNTILDQYQQLYFVRTHKSYSVNINHIKQLHVSGDQTLELTNGLKAEVSRRKRKEFLSYFSFYNNSQN
jgi:two-component system, LytTR family, response regulator